MVNRLERLADRRYVGDTSTNLAHDRWHPDCQGCGLNEVLRRGDAVGFEPDTLDGALWEGYEYCEACHDKTEPVPPSEGGADVTRDEGKSGQSARTPAPRQTTPDHEREALRREVFASSARRSK